MPVPVPSFSTDLALALSQRIVKLDGGLATELERAGHDLSGRLWSARLLADDPAAIRAAHAAYRAAGAEVLTTASYQASTEGLAAAGCSPKRAEELLRRSVTLAREALTGETQTSKTQTSKAEAGETLTGKTQTGKAQAGETLTDGRGWVAGSVGPYGATLADGSEYTGDYGPAGDVARLRAFHRPRLEILAAAGADVIAAETVPSLAEAEALVAEIDRLGLPAWLSLTTVTGPDRVPRTRRGEPAAEAFALARGVTSIVAVGVNCTDPSGVDGAVTVAAEAAGLPVVAYPNSGESWDAAARGWAGPAAGFTAEQVAGWVRAGARLVGGCCRVGPDAIAALQLAPAAR